jgi:heme/copper-type cytochrome/quinol oxidase subunit 3
VSVVPWTYEPRPDTTTNNVRLGMWLFILSEVMFFGSLFSGYALLRMGSRDWPDASGLFTLSSALLMTALLLAATAVSALSAIASLRVRLLVSSALALAFLVLKFVDYSSKISAELLPATNLLLACWFTLTGVHAAHVGAGIAANLWATAGAGRSMPRDRERARALNVYWLFVDLVWLAILFTFYLG